MGTRNMRRLFRYTRDICPAENRGIHCYDSVLRANFLQLIEDSLLDNNLFCGSFYHDDLAGEIDEIESFFQNGKD